MSEILYSCVIPVYNESLRFRKGIAGIHGYLESAARPYEIIIVDDGSVDDTMDLVKKFADGKPNVNVIPSNPNRGKGYAVRRGMEAARGKFIFFTDIDLAVPMEYVDKFLPLLEKGTEVVIGTRRTPEATIAVHQPWYREFLGEFFRRITRAFFVSHVTDFTCGFKSFEAKAAREIFRRSVIDGWSFDAETIFIADLLGYRIEEVPVVWSDDKATKVNLVRAVFNSLWELIRIRINQWRGLYR